MDSRIGTLEEGKYADIAVFDRNLLTVGKKKAKEAETVMTVMDGKIVYKRKG